MDAHDHDDPLAHLAEQLERLSEAQLKLTEATEELFLIAREDRPALRGAIGETRAAARASSDASAKVQDVADERRGRFHRD
jgi:hypothetical protein